MPTITASPSLVRQATDAVAGILNPSTALNLTGSIFSVTHFQNSIANVTAYLVLFKNALGTTLATTNMGRFTRTLATNGYSVFSNMQPLTPDANGTIAYIEILSPSVLHQIGQTLISQIGPYTMTLTVGDIGSGADVEIDDKDLVNNQPWRLNGSIRWRVPNTFNYSE
jgi:hypothetical protein